MPAAVIFVYVITLVAVFGYAYTLYSRQAKLRRQIKQDSIKRQMEDRNV